MHNKTKNQSFVSRAFALLFALFMVMFAVTPALADNDNKAPTEVNIILLLDNTGSMNGSDRSRISIASAKNFIEYLVLARRFSIIAGNDVPYINVGVYTFSNNAELICPLTDISNTGKVEDVINRINAIKYNKSGTGATYYGPALKTAYEALPTAKAGCKNLVFMFTDGKPDGKDPYSVEHGPDTAVAMLSESNVEVAVLGLDVKQSIDEEAKQLIYKIANVTQRDDGISTRAGDDQSTNEFEHSNYYIANAADEQLSSFLVSLAARAIDPETPPKSALNNKITVDKKEIVLVNIFKVDDASAEIDNVGLSFGGKQIELTETDTYPGPNGMSEYTDNTFTILYSGRSAFLTMYAPTLGTYILDLPEGAKFDVRYVEIEVAQDYSIELDIKLDDEKINECSCLITVKNGETPSSGLEALITVKAIGEDAIHTNTVKIGQPVYDSVSGTYEVRFTAGLPGEYKVIASVDEDYHTEDNKVVVEKDVVFESKRPPEGETNISLVVGKDKMLVFPTEYFPDWPGVKYSNSIINKDPEIISLTQQEDGSFIIHGNRLGKGQILDKITDEFGNEYVLTYNCKVVRNMLPIVIIAGGAVAALGALGAIAYRKFDRPLTGDFSVEYNDEVYSMIAPPRGTVFTALEIFKKDDGIPKNIPSDLERHLKETKIGKKTVSVTMFDDDGNTVVEKVKTYYVKESDHDLNNNPFYIDYNGEENSQNRCTITYSDENI